MTEVSICVPGIRTERWQGLYESLGESCKKHDFELIFCGPHALPECFNYTRNVKFIRDFGCPSRCFMLAAKIAEGDMITLTSDDSLALPGAVDDAVDQLLELEENSIVGMRYSEGQGHSGSEPPPEYYDPWHHADLRAPGVEKHWKIPILSLMWVKDFWDYPLDCAFEHTNMNLHDQAFRMQKDGYQVHMSRKLVYSCDWEPHRTPENSNLIRRFVENDRPLFHEKWKQPCGLNMKYWVRKHWWDTDRVWAHGKW